MPSGKIPCKNQPFCKSFSLLESSVVMSPCYKHAQVKAVQFKNGGRKSLGWKKLFYCMTFALCTFEVWENVFWENLLFCAVDNIIMVTFLAKLINTRDLYFCRLPSYLFLKHGHSKRLGSRKYDACVGPVVNKTRLDNIRNEKTRDGNCRNHESNTG